jgi:lactoylglutathione lyase
VGIERVDYVILYVADLDTSVAFYRDVLGLPFKFQDKAYAEFATENVKFGLLPRSELEELIGGGTGGAGPDSEVLFLVDDVDAWHQQLREQGVRILSGPTDRPWGHRTLYIEDPDGHVVELAQEIPREG